MKFFFIALNRYTSCTLSIRKTNLRDKGSFLYNFDAQIIARGTVSINNAEGVTTVLLWPLAQHDAVSDYDKQQASDGQRLCFVFDKLLILAISRDLWYKLFL